MGEKMTEESIQLLDCTIRDGGYYTNWDFDEVLIEEYLETMRVLEIDALEIGYRNPRQEGYRGEYFYTPIERIRWIKERFDGKLAVLIDVKSVNESSMVELIQPLRGLIEIIRFAVHPDKLEDALNLVELTRETGLSSCFECHVFQHLVGQRHGHQQIDSGTTICPLHISR